MRKLFIFLMGMLFGIIFLFGSIAGAGFYLYKKGSVTMFQKEGIDGLGDFNSMTPEMLVQLIIEMSNEPETKGSFGYLKEKYHLDIAKIIDPEGAKAEILESINDVQFGYLFSGNVNGFLSSVKLGVGLAFASDVVKPGATLQLQDKSVGDIIGESGSNILTNLSAVLDEVRIGAFLSSYTETAVREGGTEDGAILYYEYTYSGEGDGGLFGLLANCAISSVLKVVSGESNIFAELKVGGMKALGDKKISELLASTDMGGFVGDKTIGDLIEQKEDGSYELVASNLLNDLYVGKVLKYTIYDDTPDTDGFCNSDCAKLTDVHNHDDDCEEGCTLTEEKHVHNYKWKDANGDDAESIYKVLANINIGSLLNSEGGGITSLFNGLYIGDIMGYTAVYRVECNIPDHTHDSSCTYDICTIPLTHEHGEACMTYCTVLQNHTHGADCEAYCTIPENHTHNSECLAEGCTIPENHTHSATTCMTYCTIPENHVHSATTCDDYCTLSATHTHTPECKHEWRKGGEPVDALMGTLANLDISNLIGGDGLNLNEIFDGLYIGDIMGYDVNYSTCDNAETHTHNIGDCKHSWSNGGEPLEALMVTLADIELSKLTDPNGFKVNDIFGNLYIGELMNYTKGALTHEGTCEDGCTESHHTSECPDDCNENHPHDFDKFAWTKESGGPVTGIELALANTPMSAILGGGFSVSGIMGDVYLGDVMGYTLTFDDIACTNEDPEHQHSLSGNCPHTWLTGTPAAPVTGIELALADTQMSGILNGFQVNDIMGNVYLGDVMGYVQGNKTHEGTCEDGCTESHHNTSECSDGCNEKHPHDFDEYDWTTTGGGPVTGIELALANTKMSQILDNFNVNDIMGNVYLGEVMGYTLTFDDTACTNEDPEHQHSLAGNCPHSWLTGTPAAPVTGIELALADTKMSGILDGFKVDDIMGDVYLGEVMGYTKGDKTHQGTCPDGCAELHHNTSECTDGCNEKHPHDFDEFAWAAEGGGAVTGIELSLANTKMSEILGGGFSVSGIMGDVYLGDVMGYTLTFDDTACTNEDPEHQHSLADNCPHTWSTGTPLAPVTGIELALANTQMSQILEGFKVNDIMGDVYLGEVMGYVKGDKTHDGTCPDGCTESHHNIECPLDCDENHPHDFDKYAWTITGGGDVKGIELALANTKMSGILSGFKVNDIMGDVYLGEVMGYIQGDITNQDEVDADPTKAYKYAWTTSDNGDVKGIELALANTKMSGILDGFKVNDIMGDVYLGEVMGYVQGTRTHDGTCQDGCSDTHTHDFDKFNWTTTGGGDVKGIELALANTKMSGILNGFNVDDIMGDVYLGDVMGYVQGTRTHDGACQDGCNDTHPHDFDEFNWTNSGGDDVKGIELALANTKMKEILSGFSVENIMGDVYLGEVMGYIQGDITNQDEVDADPTKDYKYIWTTEGGGDVKGIELALANTKMNDILNGFNVETIMGDVYLGDVMGYVQGTRTHDGTCADGCSDTHPHDFDEFNWTTTGGGDVKGIELALANTKMKEILSGFSVENIMGNVYLGEVMGYVQGDITNQDEVDADPTKDYKYIWTTEGGGDVKGIELALANTKMSGILNGFNVETIMGDVYLGDVMGYTLAFDDAACVNTDPEHQHSLELDCPHSWSTSGGNEVKGMELSLADTKMGEILGGDFEASSIFGNLYLGDVLGYEKGDELANSGTCEPDCDGALHSSTPDTHDYRAYKWYDASNQEVEGIEGRLANMSMTDLLAGNLKMDTIIGDMYLGELMGYSNKDASGNYYGVTNGACDFPCDITTSGHEHEYDEYIWHDKNDVEVEDVMSIVCNILMTQVLNGELDIKDRVLALKLGDLINCEGNTVLELLADTPVNDLGSKMNTLYIGELMDSVLVYNCADSHTHTISCDHAWGTRVVIDSAYSAVSGVSGVMTNGTVFAKSYDPDPADPSNELIWVEAELDGTNYEYIDVDGLTKTMADTRIEEIGTIGDKLTNWVTTAKIYELIDMGVLTVLEDDPDPTVDSTADKLDRLFCTNTRITYDTTGPIPIPSGVEYHVDDYGNPVENCAHNDRTGTNGWQNLSLPDFIERLIDLIP